MINFDVAKVFKISNFELGKRKLESWKLQYFTFMQSVCIGQRTRNRTIKIIALFFFFKQMIKICSRKASMNVAKRICLRL